MVKMTAFIFMSAVFMSAALAGCVSTVSTRMSSPSASIARAQAVQGPVSELQMSTNLIMWKTVQAKMTPGRTNYNFNMTLPCAFFRTKTP